MSLHFEDYGEGRTGPIIFVHGAGGSSATWFMQLRGLSEQFHIIALDLNGHGKSPDREQPTLESYLEDIDEIVSRYDRPLLGGHSMGGALAQLYALRNPDKIRGIILVGTGAKLKVFPIIFDLLDNDFEGYIQAVGEYMFHKDTDRAIVEASQAETRKCPAHIVKLDFVLCNEFDIMSSVEQIQLPTLILVGDNDRMTPPKYATFLNEKIAESTMHIIEGAGHSVMIEQHAKTNRLIAEWVKELY